MDASAPRALHRTAAGLILLFALLQLAEIGRYRSINGDETYYMEAAWSMLRTGDWLIPRYADGALRFEKPIATYWAVGACTWVFGFSLWATRLHSVLFSLATLPYVGLLARVTLRDRTQALLAVVVYISLKAVHSNAHQGRTDAILSFFAAAAMAHFARALLSSHRPRRDVVLGHAFAAGAVLTKGMAGMLYIHLPLAVFALLARKRLEPGRARMLVSPRGLLTFAALVLPWFAYAVASHPDEFLDTFWHDQVTANVGSDRPFFVASFASYLWLFVRETFPWWPIVLLAFLFDRAALKRTLVERRTAWLLHGLWLGLAVLVLSCANTTRGRYLLPAFPGLAIFVSAVLSESGAAGRLNIVLVWGIRALTIGALGLVLLFIAMQWGPLWPHDVPSVGAFTFVLAVAATGLCLRARRLDLAGLTCAYAALSLGLLACGTAVLQPPAPLVQVAELGRERIAIEPATTRLTIVSPHAKEIAAALLFTSGRRPSEAKLSRAPKQQVQLVRQFLSEEGQRWLLLEESTYALLPATVKARLEVLDQRSGLLQQGLRGPVPSALAGLLGDHPAVHDTVRLLVPLDEPR